MAHEILVKIQLDASYVGGMLAEALDCVKKLRDRRDRWRRRAEAAEQLAAEMRSQLDATREERDLRQIDVEALVVRQNRLRAELAEARTELDMAFPPCPGVGGWVIVRRRHGESIEDALRNSLSDLTINATPS